jgi:nucleoside-diphosphate-sugar epimerase
VAYVAESVAEPLRYYDNITVNTVHVLEAMRAAKVHRLVYSSTCAGGWAGAAWGAAVALALALALGSGLALQHLIRGTIGESSWPRYCCARLAHAEPPDLC